MSNTLQQAHRVAELVQERVALLERTIEIENELMKLGLRFDVSLSPASKNVEAAPAVKTAPTQASDAPRRGRPPKNKSIVVSNKRKTAEDDDAEKAPDLPTLLTQIAAEAKRSLTIKDFVGLAREACHKSEAQNFSNMLYQSLLKLCRKNVLAKNYDRRDYEYVGSAA